MNLPQPSRHSQSGKLVAENVQASLCELGLLESSSCIMRNIAVVCAFVVLFMQAAFAAPRQHVVAFGKWNTVKCLIGDDETTMVEMRVRPLFVDGRTKEFTTGVAHDITERLFVVQRAYRLNDQLPQETGTTRWRWERGGWLLIDRTTGRVQVLTFPLFDPYYSEVSWFRDYAAYCGISEDGTAAFAMVAQLGRRKPLLKKAIEKCTSPAWMRAPARVTFEVPGEQKFTFTVRSHAVDIVTEEKQEAEN